MQTVLHERVFKYHVLYRWPLVPLTLRYFGPSFGDENVYIFSWEVYGPQRRWGPWNSDVTLHSEDTGGSAVQLTWTCGYGHRFVCLSRALGDNSGFLASQGKRFASGHRLSQASVAWVFILFYLGSWHFGKECHAIDLLSHEHPGRKAQITRKEWTWVRHSDHVSCPSPSAVDLPGELLRLGLSWSPLLGLGQMVR